jgi:hypothetical protein
LLAHYVPTARLDADANGVGRLLTLSGGSPEVLCTAGRLLRRESLTTPSSCAARIANSRCVIDMGVDPLTKAFEPFARMPKLMARKAGEILSWLAFFGPEAVPASWLHTLVGGPKEQTERLLSELFDLYLIHIEADAGPGAWIALDQASAWFSSRPQSADARDRLNQQLDAFIVDERRRHYAAGVEEGQAWIRHHARLLPPSTNAMSAL